MDDAAMLVDQLRIAGFDPKWKRVETEADYVAELKNSPDLIISDYSMPQFSGLEAVKLLRKSGLNIPFILISGTVGEEVAVEAMKHGASDYLLKDRVVRLGLAVEQALEKSRLQQERKKTEVEIKEQLHELQRWHEVMLRREGNNLDLKREINELLSRLGQPPRYPEAAPR